MNTDYIHKIVKACGISAGERVLVHFWGEDGDKEVANTFLAAVASRGATPILLQQARSVNCRIFKSAADTCFDDAYFEALSRFDTVLDVFAYQPIVLGYPLEPEQMDLYRQYISRLFHALMKAKRFVQIRIPTEANAEESPLTPSEYIRRMEAAYSIDYDALGAACAAAKEELQRNQRYTLQTGIGCRLSFDLTGRAWHIDAGDGDWPCGELYIAPVEAQTQGEVFFEKLFIEDIGLFENVTLKVENGSLCGSDNADVTAFIEGQLPQNRVVCELGLGMNPNVEDLCGYSVLDEKMAGSFHIAIGANTMFGGQNEAKIHMDLVGGSYELLPIK